MDDSSLIARQAAEQDARIRLLDRPAESARGAAAARNAGLRAGLGEFFAFLDADDLLEPIMLQTALAAGDAHPEAAMIFGPTQWWYPQEQRASWIEPMEGGLAGRLHQPPRLLRRIILMQDGHVPCTCSVLVRRSAIEHVGGFEERFQLYEDQALWAKLFLRYPVYLTPICLSRYRQHSGSVSAHATKRGLYDRMGAHPARATFLDWLAEYVTESRVEDRKLDRAIRLARSLYARQPTVRNGVDRLSLKVATRFTRMRRRFARKLARLSKMITGVGHVSS
jgi:glycosyltransferase involved in cell wall biosynthesis